MTWSNGPKSVSEGSPNPIIPVDPEDASDLFQVRYSVNGSSWHSTATTSDRYFSLSIDGGLTWSSALKIGNIAGPALSVDGNILVFNGTDGCNAKDSGKTVAQVLDCDNHTSGSTNVVYTATEQTKLSGIAESANNYSLPTASASTLGGVKVGDNLSISSGVLSADEQTANDFTDTLKTKLDGIAEGAQVNTVNSVNSLTGAVVLNPDNLDDTSTAHKFTTASDITKLAGIEGSADVTDAANVGSAVNGVSETAIADADAVPFYDASGEGLAKLLWSTVKSTLKTYFDTLYQAVGTYLSSLADDTSPELTGALDCNNKAIYWSLYTVTGTTPAINVANGNKQKWTLTGNSTPTISSFPGSTNMMLYIYQDASTAYTITWPTINWMNGTAPDLTTLSGKVVVCLSSDGTNLFGSWAEYSVPA